VASLQARHSRNCRLAGGWTSFSAAVDDCTCVQGPVYYVVVRKGSRADKIRVGRSRRSAERALRKISVSVDEGDWEPQLNVGFSYWAERWLRSLERKATTVRSYTPTMNYAKEAFGQKPVRRLRTEDVSKFNVLLRRVCE
jgi:hypothetical protein